MTQAKEIPALQHNFAKLPGSLALLDLPGIHRQLYGHLGPALQTKGPVAEADQGKVDQESSQWAGQKGSGCQRGIDLVNEVVGLGHWRIITREAFIDEIEGCAGGKGYEAGFDVIVQLGNWTPQGFEVLAETPCTPGGHSASSRHEVRAGALADAIMKAFCFFGIGAQAPGGEPWNDSPAPETRK